MIKSGPGGRLNGKLGESGGRSNGNRNMNGLGEWCDVMTVASELPAELPADGGVR